MLDYLRFLFSCLVPRFQVDLVAMKQIGPDDYEPICIVDDLLDHDRPDIVAKVRVFTWFNHAWPLGDKQLAMPWDEFEKNGFPNETQEPSS